VNDGLITLSRAYAESGNSNMGLPNGTGDDTAARKWAATLQPKIGDGEIPPRLPTLSCESECPPEKFRLGLSFERRSPTPFD
jgi:hypothetical protein